LRNWIAFFATTALPASASAQAVGLDPAAAADIAGAVSDCWKAVGVRDVNRSSLAAAGWKTATATDPKGGSVTSPPGLYGQARRNAVIMVPAQASQPMCSVIARVPSQNDLGPAVATIQKALVELNPKVETARDGNSIYFLALPKLAMVDPTGSKDRPGMRIVVGYQNSEKK